ncbi:hypothetical protein GCM10010124_04740 [Pilimelia terevasa]|uniref:DUF1501 domain-containing protein n=1 Tax=Pilimelia terevasa TaxID=53372 RepID=A0A8J3BK98_9ACTN|nr:DUF1501 domain-containing protein [Pilimelia terevasa]GGK15203.1 hypothetical protein GCM10010124_04740 [Pilimelia terevasa]
MNPTPTCGCPENTRVAGLTRRGLLGRAAAVGAAGTLGGLAADGLASSLAFAAAPYTGDTLVVLSLRGGFDGLSAVVPHGDPAYYQARPGIGVPKARLVGGDAMFGLHPALAPVLPLWRGGQLGAVHAVGQPNPSRSHFAAMEELERAAAGTSVRTGWIDRMLGAAGATSPFQGVAVGDSLAPRSMRGPAVDLSLRSIDGFQLAGEGARRPMAATVRALYDGAPSVLAAPATAAVDALGTAAALKAAGYTPANGAVYPAGKLGAALRDVARLVKAQVGLMVASVDFGDWDMHEGLGTPVAGQSMYDQLSTLAKALAAFAADLGPEGLGNVTLITLSEFGRRVAENGSRGADHGHGNAMLLLGGGVRGGRVYGRWPGLAPAKLVAGDLAATTDYRAVIAEVLARRCGMASPAAVFPSLAPAPLDAFTAR